MLNRRSLLARLLALPFGGTALITAACDRKPKYETFKPPTLMSDAEYASIYKETDVLPWFNGKPVRGVIEANVKEGWLIAVKDPSLHNYELRKCKFYGRVQLFRGPPEYRKDWMENAIWLA